MPSARSLRGLDLLNFFLADVQTGIGPNGVSQKFEIHGRVEDYY